MSNPSDQPPTPPTPATQPPESATPAPATSAAPAIPAPTAAAQADTTAPTSAAQAANTAPTSTTAQADTPPAAAQVGAEPVGGEDAPVVTIHRAPRYFRFVMAGGVLGLVVALVLTFSFPEPPGFDLPQVFGFLAILFVIAGFAVGAVVALLADRASRRRLRPIQMERELFVDEAEAEHPEAS